jgi:hypothetical protein
MTEAYWTHCMYCGAMICGVEILEEYPDVVVLYAHKTCHEARSAMDPTATWQMLCEYLRALHEHPDDEEIRTNVVELLGALTRWLRRGGFPPTLT